MRACLHVQELFRVSPPPPPLVFPFSVSSDGDVFAVYCSWLYRKVLWLDRKVYIVSIITLSVLKVIHGVVSKHVLVSLYCLRTTWVGFDMSDNTSAGKFWQSNETFTHLLSEWQTLSGLSQRIKPLPFSDTPCSLVQTHRGNYLLYLLTEVCC